MTRFATFEALERAVLTAVIVFPEHALPLVPELEIDDFWEPLHRHAFCAVRNLEAAGKPIGVLPVADVVFAGYQLANDGKCNVYDECRVICGLGIAIVSADGYADGELEKLLPRHARALRTIRYAREERMAG